MFSDFYESSFRALPPVVERNFDFWRGKEKKKPTERAQPLDLKKFWRGVVGGLLVGASLSVAANQEFRSPSSIFEVSAFTSFDIAADCLRGDDLGLNFSRISMVDLDSASKINFSRFARAKNCSLNSSISPITAGSYNYFVDARNAVPVLSDSSLFGSAIDQGGEKLDLISAVINISDHTREVIGANGVKRLQKFSILRDGWDGSDSYSMRSESIHSFDRFFAVEKFRPAGVSVFLSPEGNVVANWYSTRGLVELEFVSDGARYIIDDGLIEGSVSKANFGDFRRTIV